MILPSTRSPDRVTKPFPSVCQGRRSGEEDSMSARATTMKESAESCSMSPGDTDGHPIPGVQGCVGVENGFVNDDCEIMGAVI